jgi:hypothetical protein
MTKLCNDLCDDLREFAVQVHRLGYSSATGKWRERECQDICECMLVAVMHAEARMAGAKSTAPAAE